MATCGVNQPVDTSFEADRRNCEGFGAPVCCGCGVSRCGFGRLQDAIAVRTSAFHVVPFFESSVMARPNGKAVSCMHPRAIRSTSRWLLDLGSADSCQSSTSASKCCMCPSGPRVPLGLEMDDEPPAEQYDIPETIDGVRCSLEVAYGKACRTLHLWVAAVCFFCLLAPPSGCHDGRSPQKSGGLCGTMFRPSWSFEIVTVLCGTGTTRLDQ